MQKFLRVFGIILAVSEMRPVFADPHDPRTMQGKCAKVNGGHYVPGTKHRWQTYNIDAWNKCVNQHALAEKRAMGFKD